MAMENKRIIQLNTERTTPAADDYVMVDSATAGTAKYLLPKITDAIDQEISDRTSADTALQTAITNETTARANADTTLQGNITAEATARAEADTAINGEITQLKEDLSFLTDNVFYTYTKDKSISRGSIPTQATEANWESAVVECSAGDVFYVKGYGGNNTRLWMFAKSNGTVITESATGLHSSDLIKIVAPAEVKYLCVNSQYTQIKGELIGEAVLRDIVDDMGDTLDGVASALSDYVEVASTSVEEGKIYSNSYKTGYSMSGYNTYNYPVEAGKKYYISTSVIGASGYSVCYGFKNGTWSHSYGDYPAYSGAVSNYELDATGYEPYDIDTIKVTVVNSVVPTVKTIATTSKNIPQEISKLNSNCVKFASNECHVKAKYDATHDIVFRINKGGGNTLPDIRYAYLVNNSGELNTDIVASRYIISNPSDIFSPSVVYANQNADGDNITSGYFTGGNHRTTNVGTGGGITAHNESFTVYCDGKAVTDWAFGNEVVVKWVNELNGYNTSKSDGTGRDIVREEITLTIHGTRIDVEIVHTALESITYETYYGLQMICSDMSNIRYYGGSNRNKYNPQQASNSGDKKCRNIVLTNSYNDALEVAIDEIDIGDFAKDTLAYSAFTTVAKKSYFGLMYNAGMALAEDDCFVVRGHYNFKPVLS